MNSFLPVTNLLIAFGALPFSILFAKYIFTAITIRQSIIIYIAVLLVANIIYIPSVLSYYEGMTRPIKRENIFAMRFAEEIFNTSMTFDEMCKAFKANTENINSAVRIVNIDSNERCIRDAPTLLRRDLAHRILEIDNENSKKIKTKVGELEFEFTYSVRANILLVLLRANTCSLVDMLIERITLNNWWERYLERNFKRSNDLLLSIVILLLFVYGVLYFYIKKSKEHKELLEFKTIHKKMFSDLTNEINHLKQPIQEFNFSWDYYIGEIFRTEKHDLANKISHLPESTFNAGLSSHEKEFADRLKEHFDSMINIVLDNMGRLPEIVKYELIDSDISETIDSITKPDEAVPKLFLNNKAGVNFDFKLSNDFAAKDGEFCKINKHRLSSIVFNLLANANKATEVKKNNLRITGNHKDYTRKIWLYIDRYCENNDNYLKISVKDNAGGFPSNIKNNIYRTPVASSKKNPDGTTRIGEGSVYVSFFAKYMNIKLEADNYTLEDGTSGAEVNLLIPICINGDDANG